MLFAGVFLCFLGVFFVLLGCFCFLRDFPFFSRAYHTETGGIPLCSPRVPALRSPAHAPAPFSCPSLRPRESPSPLSLALIWGSARGCALPHQRTELRGASSSGRMVQTRRQAFVAGKQAGLLTTTGAQGTRRVSLSTSPPGGTASHCLSLPLAASHCLALLTLTVTGL